MTPEGGSQQIKYPIPTDAEGDFDGFVQINDAGLNAGNSTSEIQRLNVYTEGDVNGNATAYLVPSTGLGIISDIDDILRVTQIYEPSLGLLNTFAKPFTPWMNMPYVMFSIKVHPYLGLISSLETHLGIFHSSDVSRSLLVFPKRKLLTLKR